MISLQLIPPPGVDRNEGRESVTGVSQLNIMRPPPQEGEEARKEGQERFLPSKLPTQRSAAGWGALVHQKRRRVVAATALLPF